MVGVVLVVSGLVAAVHGTWRGDVAAGSALVPHVREGDPTPALYLLTVGTRLSA